jgi:hypothetical protein
MKAPHHITLRATAAAADSRTFASCCHGRLRVSSPADHTRSNITVVVVHRSVSEPQLGRPLCVIDLGPCRPPVPWATSPTALAPAPHTSEAAKALPAAVAHHHRLPQTAPLRVDRKSRSTVVGLSSPRHPHRLRSTWPPHAVNLGSHACSRLASSKEPTPTPLRKPALDLAAARASSKDHPTAPRDVASARHGEELTPPPSSLRAHGLCRRSLWRRREEKERRGGGGGGG